MSFDTLHPDVKAYFPEDTPDHLFALSRISLSAGTVDASSVGLPYVTHARIPIGEWRIPTPVELHNILTLTPLPRSNCVVISRILGQPELTEIHAEFRTIRSRFGNPQDLNERLISLVTPILRSKCQICDVSKVFGLNTDPGRLPTTSINRQINLFAGLHVDVWEERNLDERHLCANRISISLGKSHRYFLFVGVSVAEMKEALADCSIGNELTSIAYVTTRFLEKYPDYPVVRIRLEGGEAYFAPTENIIHDGSTSDCAVPPYTFAMQGVFQF